MSWIQITVSLDASEIESFETALIAADAVAVTYESSADEVVLEPAPGAIPMWQQISLLGLFPVSADITGLNDALRALDPNIHQRLGVDFIAEEDWHQRLANHTVRAEFGSRLWLLPKTEYGKDVNPTADANAGRAEIKALYLEPGLAFGSGSHPTTRLCLDWIARRTETGHQTLDFGCGSGILAIAAALLGATVVAVDHDPQALIATRENAEFNGVGDRIKTLSLDQWEQAQAQYTGYFDAIVANILAGPIVDLAPTFCRALRPDGTIALSGILDQQAGQVMDAYSSIAFEPVAKEEEWVCLVGGLRN